MNVVQVVEELVSMAGTGEAHEHTLLLVFGDHGQTLTGDHGGGAPEEVDSALLALNMGAYHQIRSASECNCFTYARHTGGNGHACIGEKSVSDRLFTYFGSHESHFMPCQHQTTC